MIDSTLRLILCCLLFLLQERKQRARNNNEVDAEFETQDLIEDVQAELEKK